MKEPKGSFFVEIKGIGSYDKIIIIYKKGLASVILEYKKIEKEVAIRLGLLFLLEEKNIKKKGLMNMYFRKPTLKNLSQGARLEYVRRLRHMDADDVAEYFEFGGDDPHKTFRYYENNDRSPSKERLMDIVNLYEVSINAIKRYDFNNPIDVVYFHMWLEEEFPYFEINFDSDSFEKTEYNDIVQKAMNKWKEMRDKRENLEISDEEYLEWKLNYEISIPIK